MTNLPSDPGPDLLDAATWQDQLTTRTFGRQMHVLPSTPSTNDVLKQLALSGAPEGTVVLADQQTQGRGRQGRAFASPAGVGIYLSLLLRPTVALASLPTLTLACGVATAHALADIQAPPVQLKWPNDVEMAGKKVAGILCEAVLQPSAAPVVIVGIGMNVNTTLADFPPALHGSATSLALVSGHAWARTSLITRLLVHLEQVYALFQQGDHATIIAQWLRYGPIHGRRVRFQHEGHEMQGTVVGLEEDGALQVQTPQGPVQRLVAGEVVFV